MTIFMVIKELAFTIIVANLVSFLIFYVLKEIYHLIKDKYYAAKMAELLTKLKQSLDNFDDSKFIKMEISEKDLKKDKETIDKK